MKIISYPPLVLTYSCFSANIIQFATDQMIEIRASGEELSALIHWQYWAMSLGLFVQKILVLISFFMCLLALFLS